MLHKKAMINSLVVGLIKKMLLYKKSYFQDTYTRIKKKTKVKLDLSNYATKCGLKTQQVVIHQILKSLIWLA